MGQCEYLGTYDHWVEPSFRSNVGTFLKGYFFQELHTSAQSDQHLCSLPIDSRITNLSKSRISIL